MSIDKTRINSRPATVSDVAAFYGEKPRQTVRARVLEKDGAIVGLAGYYVAQGRALVFSDMREPLPKMTIWREAKHLMDSLKIPAVCIAEDESGSFLTRLGWQYVGRSEDGEVYQWQR